MPRKHVFLDANVFVRAQFNMSNTALKRLEELSRLSAVKLVITDIVKSEVERKIAEAAKKAKGLHHSFTEPAAAAATQAFNEFLTRAGAVVVSTRDLPCGPIMDRYFAKEPLFEGDAREFPDAVSLYGLLAWMKLEAVSALLFVSNDGALGRAVEEFESLSLHTHLTSALDAIASELEEAADLADVLKEALAKRRQELQPLIGDVFTELGFFLENADGDVDEVTEPFVSLSDDATDFDIVEMHENGKATLSAFVDVTFKASVAFFDDASGSHDNETGAMFFRDQITTTIEPTEELELYVQVEFDPADPTKLSIESIDLFPKDIGLSVPDRDDWHG